MAEQLAGGSSALISRRSVCAGLAATVAARPAPALALAGPFEAVVRRAGGTHSSLAAAVAAAPGGARPYRILLGAGRWEEKIVVTRANLELVGEDRQRSILTSAISAGHDRPGGGKWGTFGSATLTVEAPGLTLRNLTVENGFDYPTHRRSGGKEGAQAVAVALGNAADRTLVEGVNIFGYQDSFYLRAARALIRKSLIMGNVDFIFGGAAALFDACEIRSRLRPDAGIGGYIAAPSTNRNQRFGFVFDRCRLTREPGLPDSSVYLGRPWRAGGNTDLRGAAVYLNCWMDGHIHPDGWTWMGYRGPGGYPMIFDPGDARFGEFASIGPGARAAPTRPIFSRSEAADYSREAMFQDWRPD